MEVWKTEDPRVNFEKRFAHYEIYTWTLCHAYLHEKQTSRLQSLIQHFSYKYLFQKVHNEWNIYNFLLFKYFNIYI